MNAGLPAPACAALERGGFCWRVDPSVRAHLEAEYAGREERLRQAAARAPLKDNNARAIFRLAGPDGARWLVKWFKPRGWRGGLARLLRGSHAQREWDNQVRLAAAGVPTSASVAVAERRGLGGGGEAFLFVREVADARSLRDALRQEGTGLGLPGRRRLVERLADLVARMHAAGFDHRDLHAGNVLVSGPLSPEAPLLLIDLHRGDWRRRVGPARRLGRLARLVHSLAAVLPRTDGVRFLRAYFAATANGGTQALGARRLVRRVLAQAAVFGARLVARRTRRCLHRSSVFGVKRSAEGTLYYRRALASADIVQVIARHDAVRRVDRALLLKDLPDRSLSRGRLRLGDADVEVAVKEFRPVGLLGEIKRLAGHSPARQAWLAAHGFAVRGQPTAQGLALYEEAAGPRAGRSLLLTEWIAGAIAANRYVEEVVGGAAGPGRLAARRGLVAALAAAVRGLHRAGIHHHDLKANNLLMAPAAPAHRVWFLDLDRVTFGTPPGVAARQKALAQLNASMPASLTRTDRLRFLHAYAKGDPAFRDLRARARAIQALTIARRHVWPPWEKVPGDNG